MYVPGTETLLYQKTSSAASPTEAPPYKGQEQHIAQGKGKGGEQMARHYNRNVEGEETCVFSRIGVRAAHKGFSGVWSKHQRKRHKK